METIFTSTKNSKANETHKFVPTLQRQLDLKSLNKHLSPHDLSVYYTWKILTKNIRPLNSILKLQHRMIMFE